MILVRRETNPDDYHGMVASQGILTSAGGTNSHAAVVARGEGIPAVCGAESIRIDRKAKKLSVKGVDVKEGAWLTIDGTDGTVYAEELETEPSVLEAAILGDDAARNSKLWNAYERFMKIADERRRLRVRANADTPDQSRNARARGAQGIGLCRTEHMFLGEERAGAVRQMIFADSEEDEQKAYDVLVPLQKQDFLGIFEAMDGLPVTVRLLDPPLHEFLPDHTELSVEVALAEAGVKKLKKKELEEKKELLAKVDELREANPMLGLRGVRLGIFKPGLYAMQVRAIADAAAELKKKGKDPRPEIMIPLVATAEELQQMREELEPMVVRILEDAGVDLHVEFGTMIELPARRFAPARSQSMRTSSRSVRTTCRRPPSGSPETTSEASSGSTSTGSYFPPIRSKRSTSRGWGGSWTSRSSKDEGRTRACISASAANTAEIRSRSSSARRSASTTCPARRSVFRSRDWLRRKP